MIPTLQLGALGRARRALAGGGGGGGGGPPETNLVLWLDAADEDTFTLNGSLVSQWDDKSVSANHAVAASAGGDRSPTKSGDSVVFNTSGLVKGLVCPTLFIASGAFSYYLVWKRDLQRNDVVLQSSGAHYAYLQYVSNWYVGDSAQSNAFANNTVAIKSCRSNSSSEVVRATNGVEAASTGVAGSPASRAIGASNTYGGGFDGTVYEFLVYSVRLSDANNTAVIDYLKTKWGIA